MNISNRKLESSHVKNLFRVMRLLEVELITYCYCQVDSLTIPVLEQLLNERFHRADSWIRLQWCQEITFHECAKIAKY